ncbi:MAG TPA: hypothetical protein ENK33_13125 [Desulfobacterales bacterium]|nr:hypothetical protein [Desulfobacterales bacterium]
MITAKKSRPWLKICVEQKGGMTLLAAGGIFTGVLILFMVVNIGNMYATKAKLNNAAQMMADTLLSNQLKNPNPTPTKLILIKKLDKDAGLKASLGKVTYRFQFGYTTDKGKHFIPIAKKNPTPADFYTASGGNANTMPAIAFEITTPILDIGNFFNLLGNIKGRSIRFLDYPFKKIINKKKDCICQQSAEQTCGEVCEGKPLYNICTAACIPPKIILCNAIATLAAMIKTIKTLNPTYFLAALRCAFSDMIFVMHTMIVTAWDWSFTAYSVIVSL